MTRNYGEIDGIAEGSTWMNRRDMHDAGVHRPLQAGISGGADGADSIVISGGYEDDEDHGTVIIYTGQGGQDDRGNQIKDQELSLGNLGLAVSHDESHPIRVIRGSRARSEHAPHAGFRYDGLFRVEDYWLQEGSSGFKVWRFKLVKIRSISSPTQKHPRPVERPPMGGISADVRQRAIAWLTMQSSLGISSFSMNELADFSIRGLPFALKGRRSEIYIPRGWNEPLSISTPYPSPSLARLASERVLTDDGVLHYPWQGNGAHSPENESIRNALRHRTPLIWFFGAGPGSWLPVCPVYAIHEDATSHQFTFVTENDLADSSIDIESPPTRRYMRTEILRRVHQPLFRSMVMRAYRTRCAVCSIRHSELLDAAHIIPDVHPNGNPSIRNGIALCKIHHAAFDAHILGIRPDHVVKIRQDLLDEIDGPMLRHGLQDLHDHPLMTLPQSRQEWPDTERLAWAFQAFQSATLPRVDRGTLPGDIQF